MEEGEDLPVNIIKEECLIFEEENTKTFHEYSQFDGLLENLPPVKKEKEKDFFTDLSCDNVPKDPLDDNVPKDPLGDNVPKDPLGDIVPKKEEPDEEKVDESKPTVKAGQNKPPLLLKSCSTEGDATTRTTPSLKSYLGAELDKDHKEKGWTRSLQLYRECLRTCTVSLQDVLKSEDFSTGVRRCEPVRGRVPLDNNITVPASDDFLHCQECFRKYEGDCPKHGPLIVVMDTPVPVNINDKSRAKKTVPPQVSVAESSVLNAGSGVVARETIPARTRFGPYEGKVIPPKADALPAWMVWKDGKPDHSLDASESGLSNWMRFVNFAKCDEEQNLAAFQYKGKIYFKTLRKVASDEELLVSDGKHDEESGGAVNAGEKHASNGLTRETAVDDFGRMQNAKSTFSAERTLPSIYSLEKECNEHTLLLTDVREVDREKTRLICSQCGKSSSQEDSVANHRKNHARQNLLLSNKVETLTNRQRSNNGQEPFVCAVCDKRSVINGFSVEPNLKVHLRTGNGEKSGMSNERNRRFSSKTSLITNFNSHMGDRSLVRALAEETIPQYGKLTDDVVTHNVQRPFPCKQCNRVFLNESRLQAHLRMHSGYLPFACQQCHKRFARKYSLDVHVLTHSGELPFACDHCNQRFTKTSDLTRHLFAHSGERPFECAKCHIRYPLKESLKKHILSHSGEKPYACTQCDKAFALKTVLKQHVFRTHRGVKPFSCTECTKAFAVKKHLTVHLRSHSGEKPFPCTQCKKAFSHEGNLQVHLRTHSGEMPFGCEHCHKRFATRDTLKKHLTLHNRTKPFACEQCNISFSTKQYWKRHLGMHSGEKPFACIPCNLVFTLEKTLEKHLLLHSGDRPFACTQCDKTYSTKQRLQRHLLFHSGERPFPCKYCPMRFAHNHNLKRHLLRHSSREGPFVCAHCNKEFTSKGPLRQHLRLLSEEEPFACT